jgi:hypothetical protein
MQGEIVSEHDDANTRAFFGCSTSTTTINRGACPVVQVDWDRSASDGTRAKQVNYNSGEEKERLISSILLANTLTIYAHQEAVPWSKLDIMAISFHENHQVAYVLSARSRTCCYLAVSKRSRHQIQPTDRNQQAQPKLEYLTFCAITNKSLTSAFSLSASLFFAFASCVVASSTLPPAQNITSDA